MLPAGSQPWHRCLRGSCKTPPGMHEAPASLNPKEPLARTAPAGVHGKPLQSPGRARVRPGAPVLPPQVPAHAWAPWVSSAKRLLFHFSILWQNEGGREGSSSVGSTRCSCSSFGHPHLTDRAKPLISCFALSQTSQTNAQSPSEHKWPQGLTAKVTRLSRWI